MTYNYEPHDLSGKQEIRDMDNLQRNCFELLSAYLDGEVTVDERKQVQYWLDNDPEIQQQYVKLLKLRQGIQTLPVPTVAQTATEIAEQVFIRLNKYRVRRFVAWGSTAIAALFIGAVSGVLSPNHPTTQLANSSPSPAAPETLMVALNAPPVKIPKAAIADPETSFESSGAELNNY
jgi:anti-sigma factor RsiW